MASSTGSSRWFRRPSLSRALLGLAVLGLATAGCAALPGYAREALDHFNPELPPGWAYTTTTVRGEVSTAERFDPAKPPGARWTLLRYNGRPPGTGDLEKYRRLRAANPAPVSSATFARGDIEPGSLQLVAEDDERAEFQGGFREAAAGADKMLRHLQVRLTVNKRQPHVEKYILRLPEPYSPVLGVKMNELRVEATFTPPAPGRPSLPAALTSRFAGRIFFIRTQEDLQVVYSEFSPGA